MSAEDAIRKDDLYIHVLPASLKLHTLGAEMSGDPGANLSPQPYKASRTSHQNPIMYLMSEISSIFQIDGFSSRRLR